MRHALHTERAEIPCRRHCWPHATALSEWGNVDCLVQAHGEFGSEMEREFGLQSMISFTTDPRVAEYFSKRSGRCSCGSAAATRSHLRAGRHC